MDKTNKMDKTKSSSSEAGKKDKMRNNRRCIIYGCNSSSLKDKDLKFFRFPSPDSADYQIWLSACKDSYNQIRVLKKPLICSLHFVPEDIGGRRLSPNAFPRLRLTASQEYIDFQERDKKIRFLNEVMEEWLVRNRPHCDIYGKLLIERAREARDLLDIPNYIPDKSWLNNFNEQIAAPDSKLFRALDTCGTSLHMLDVIRDLTHLKQQRQDRRQGSFAENSIEISDDDDYDDGDFSDSYADLSSKLEVSVTVDEDREFYEPQAKMPKLQSILLTLDDEDDEDDGDDDDDDNTGASDNQKQKKKKKAIGTYKDALKYMKPLENFALQNADFRAIGLLTQLEAIFKQQQ